MEQGLFATITLGLFGLGVALMNVAHNPHFWLARFCFGAATVSAVGQLLWWGVRTDMALPGRALIIGAGAAVAAILCSEALRWVANGERVHALQTGPAPASTPRPPLPKIATPAPERPQGESKPIASTGAAPATAQPPVISQNVTSYNQAGGITAHTVNLGAPRRSLDGAWGEPLKAQMLRDLPRDRPITVEAIMGDGEAAEFALLVHAFLKANGFTMAGEGISHRVAEVPPINQTVEPNNAGGLSFIVGHFRP